MKQIVLLILAVVATFLLPGLAGAETIVLKRGIPTDIWTTWPGGDELDQQKFVDVFPEYRQEFKGGEFKLVKDAGFDFVRLTIDPGIFVVKRRPDKTAKLLLGTKAAIDEILAAGLKVDLDMHIIPRDGNDPGTDQMLREENFKTYLEVVRDIGTLAARYPADKLSFEPMNEPTLDCAYELNGAKPRWPNLLPRLYKAARSAAPKTTLVMSGGCWGGADGLAAVDPAAFADENIIWSFHTYEPFIVSHQGASWTQDVVGFVSGLSFPPVPGERKRVEKAALKRITASDLVTVRKRTLTVDLKRKLDRYFEKGAATADLKRPFEVVEAWAKRHRIPSQRILLGEFGAIRGDKFSDQTDAARVALITAIRSEAEKRGYAWSCWSWSGSFGISRTADTREFSPALLEALRLKP